MEGLHPGFVDWWFRQAPLPSVAGKEHSLIAQRDFAYASPEDDVPRLPPVMVAAWSDVCELDSESLSRACMAFGAILAAQAPQDVAWAASLPRDLREWGLRTANIQPLPRRIDATFDETSSSWLRGLAELSLYLDDDFPGLWSRLRRELSNQQHAYVATLRAQARLGDVPAYASRRALRCWQLAVRQTALSHVEGGSA